MIIPEAVVDVGKFLVEHGDIVKDVVDALASGAPKDAIKAGIRGAMVKVSDAAITEELESAEARDAGDGSP